MLATRAQGLGAMCLAIRITFLLAQEASTPKYLEYEYSAWETSLVVTRDRD